MVAGIVLFAFGVKSTLAHSTSPLPTIPALGLAGGVALYLLAHVLLRLRLGAGMGRGRPVAFAVLLALFPIIRSVPGLVALALVTTVCVSLIAYEFFRHREERAQIRSSSRALRHSSTP
jgi:low temperature requirement protein LtrA